MQLMPSPIKNMNNIPNSSPNPPHNTISFEVVPTGMQYDENTVRVPVVFQRVDEKNRVHYHLCNVGKQDENTSVLVLVISRKLFYGYTI